jgi:hypothetical protein
MHVDSFFVKALSRGRIDRPTNTRVVYLTVLPRHDKPPSVIRSVY